MFFLGGGKGDMLLKIKGINFGNSQSKIETYSTVLGNSCLKAYPVLIGLMCFVCDVVYVKMGMIILVGRVIVNDRLERM
jgi:hypothetical protein